MTISIIAAMDSKNGFGKNNSMPWHISDDFKRFKNLTLGHSIIMGRKTFESIGRVLPGRTNIIITRDSKFNIQDLTPQVTPQGVALRSYVAHSLEEAIKRAKTSKGSDEIFIIGGGQIFKHALEKNLVDKLYLTIVDGDFGADTFFPAFSNFKIVSSQDGQPGEYKYKFVNLEK